MSVIGLHQVVSASRSFSLAESHTNTLPSFTRMIPVAGYCGIPNTAQAVSANLAVTQPVAGGWVSIWPEGSAQPSPLVAAINYAAGQTINGLSQDSWIDEHCQAAKARHA
jgi:hypothetical protein